MSKRLQLVVAQLAADGSVGDRGERRLGAFRFDAFAGFFAEAGDVAQAETKIYGVRGYGIRG